MSMSRVMKADLDTTDKGTTVVAGLGNMSTDSREKGIRHGNSVPSDLTGSLLLLLSMGGWVTEAECVCGEFLWVTADILFDDEILRVSPFLLRKPNRRPSRKIRHTAPALRDTLTRPRMAIHKSNTRTGVSDRVATTSSSSPVWRGGRRVLQEIC